MTHLISTSPEVATVPTHAAGNEAESAAMIPASATLPDPASPAVSSVIYTRAENQINMDGAQVTVLIDGSDLVLKAPDGKSLILPLAAELASYEPNLFSFKFTDGIVLTSDDLLRLGKVVSIGTPAPKNHAAGVPASADPQVIIRVVEKVVEKVVDHPVESVVVIEQEVSGEASATQAGQLGNHRNDILALTKATQFTAWHDDAPLTFLKSSGTTYIPAEPAPEPVIVPPIKPVTPTDPTGDIHYDPLVKLYQLDAVIDPVNRVYKGGAAKQGAQVDGSLGAQYGVKSIDLSAETRDWTVYADDPDRLAADIMTRVIRLTEAVDAVHIVRGLPSGYRAVVFGTDEGNAYGLKAGEVLLLYPQGSHDSMSLTFQYQTQDGTPTEHQATFVVMDKPLQEQREDGAFVLASRPENTLVTTGSGNDTIHAGFTNVIIHAGAGDDTIIASTAKGAYDGGAGTDTVDYSKFASGITVDLRQGYASVGGESIHTLTDVERVIATRFNDKLVAGARDSQLFGGDGDDTFVSGAGNNLLSGGVGRDTVDYSSATSGVVASLQQGHTEVGKNGFGGTDRFEGIEDLIGSRFNDVLQGDDGDNFINAGGGDDLVLGSGGSDRIENWGGRDTLDYSSLNSAISVILAGPDGVVAKSGGGTDHIYNFAEVVGTRFNDTFRATAGAWLRGGDGDDTFIANWGGNNMMDGGEGRDLVDFRDLTLSLYVDLKTGFSSGLTVKYVNGDLVFQSNGGTTLGLNQLVSIEDVYGSLNVDNNFLVGSDSDNYLKGGYWTNYYEAGGGDNTLDGVLGAKDYARYATSAVGIAATLDASGNGTTVRGSNTDTLMQMEGIWGSDFNDTLTAQSDSALLFGGRGNDIITGGTAHYGWGATQGAVIDLGGGGNAGTSAGVGVVLNDGYGTQDQLINVNNVNGTTSFDDTIWGNDHDNIITEVSGNNYIYGSKGNDTLQLGTGNNTVDYSLLDRGVSANLLGVSQTVDKGANGRDSLSGVYNLTGTVHDDTLIGNNENNTLIGGGGADVLVGNGGNDVLVGGADGLTTASYYTSPQGIDANLSNGSVKDGFGTIDLLAQIGKIVGSSMNDRFGFSSQSDLGRYQIDGGAGGTDMMVKQGAGGSFALDASVRFSHISAFDFADGQVDHVSINLNDLVSGMTDNTLTVKLDAQDTFTISQTGWTMTENTTDQQSWSQGTHTVVVAH